MPDLYLFAEKRSDCSLDCITKPASEIAELVTFAQLIVTIVAN